MLNLALLRLNKKEEQLIKLRYLEYNTITFIMAHMKISRRTYGDIESKALKKLKRDNIVQELKEQYQNNQNNQNNINKKEIK